MASRTLYDKVWDSHVVKSYADGSSLLYIDRHLVQEVSSPQAFEGLATAGRPLWRPDANIAVADHAVPTRLRHLPMVDGLAARQVGRLIENARAFAIPYIPVTDRRHGIAHVIGPELGFTLPGSTLVCGDSHTCTHGAFGALAFGIGASECEMVLATQTLRQTKQKTMRVVIDGVIPACISAKDIILAVIAKIGTGGGLGHAIEYAGTGVVGLSMEARMTLCNMSIEAGSRVGMVAPDDKTFAYLEGRPLAPCGQSWERAVAEWAQIASDPDAEFDREVRLDIEELAPHVSWGTTPEQSMPVGGRVPDPAAEPDGERRARMQRSLDYMGLAPGTPIEDIAVDMVFIGSCTNGRLEDLRRAAGVLVDRRIAPGVSAIAVPGSAGVKLAAEAEGLDAVFLAAGFEWRDAGCSMCVGMNDDRLGEGQRCASTSNRNFEGRQGIGGRTHLMSPEMAAAAAVTGRITDVRRLKAEDLRPKT